MGWFAQIDVVVLGYEDRFVLPFADTSGTFRFRTHDQELFPPRRVSPVDRIERATSAVAEMQPRRLGKAVCESPPW